jgi:hypothetical protein
MTVTVNGFNIGTDCSVTFSDNYGDSFTAQDLGHLMDVETAATDTAVKITPITGGGVPIFQTVWDGGTGRLTFSRVNTNLQQMILDLMSAYFSSGIIPVFSMMMNVLDRNGTVDEYLYSGLQFTKPNFGNFAALKEVNQMVDLVWAQCVATGGGLPFLSGVAAAA